MDKLDIPYGYSKGKDIFLSAWDIHPDRKVGEVKEEGLEAAVKYFQNRFNELKQKIDNLVETIDTADNKGSFLMKLIHLRESLPHHDGLGDYPELLRVLNEQEQLLRDIIDQNRERNTQIKEALLNELQEAVQIVNWNEATPKVQDVKERWVKTGNAREERQAELEADFWSLVENFFERKKAFFEDKRKLTDARRQKYQDLIDETSLLQDLKGKERFDKVKELKARWQEVGNIPSQLYKSMLIAFNNRLKKPRAGSGDHGLDLERVKKKLDTFWNREVPMQLDDLQQIRKQVMAYRTNDLAQRKHRGEVLDQVQLLIERDFLENLAKKKNKDFDRLDEDKRQAILTRLLSELLQRDEDDLTRFEENQENFSSHDPDTVKMVEKKLRQQRTKISVKKKLLSIYKRPDAKVD